MRIFVYNIRRVWALDGLVRANQEYIRVYGSMVLEGMCH